MRTSLPININMRSKYGDHIFVIVIFINNFENNKNHEKSVDQEIFHTFTPQIKTNHHFRNSG